MRYQAAALFAIPFVLAGAGAAIAQAPGGVRPAILVTEIPQRGPMITPIVVVDRLLSFDADSDHRIARDELPERMHGLVTRGDKNRDGFLDSDEIRALISAPPPGPPRASQFRRDSEGLPGVIRDLKLPAEKHTRALDIVRAHKIPRNVNDPNGVELYDAMRELLDGEDYENFVAAATRLTINPSVTIRTTIRGINRPVPGRP